MSQTRMSVTEQGIVTEESAAKEMAEKGKEFVEKGAEVYAKA